MIRFLCRKFAALTAAGLLAGAVFAGGEGWTADYTGAKQTAASDGKDMLLDFTGSDWCGWCIKLNEEVFSHGEFKAYADENFVLVELDFPQSKPQSEELKAQNQGLMEKFGVQGFPTILLVDAQGRPYAQTGYQPGGPEAYVEHLEALRAVRLERDEKLAAAEAAEGVEKARLLHEAMQAVGDDLALSGYDATVRQIIELDADNAAGLKQHYGDKLVARDQKRELDAVMAQAGEDPAEAVKKVDEMLAREDLLPAIRQEALTAKSSVYMFALEDKDAAYKTLREAIAVLPDSELAMSLHEVIKQYFPDAVE